MSNNDDFDAVLSSAGGTSLTVSGSTFEGITFARPSNSLTIQGLDGNDSITVLSIDMGSTNLTIEAETIRLSAGQTITSSGNVALLATAQDGATITDASQIVNRAATVTIEGNINTTGNITLSAEVIRNIDISFSSLLTLTLAGSSVAKVEVKSGTQLTATDLQISATTRGTVSAENSLFSASNKLTDSALASIDGSVMDVVSLTINALRSTEYTVKGRNAFNEVSGDAKATIKNSTVDAESSGVTVSAENAAKFTAESPEFLVNLDILSSPVSIDFSAGRNHLTGDTEASISNSTVTVTASGSINVLAKRNLQVKARAETDSIVASTALPNSYSLSLNGTYTSNTVLGDVKASVEGSTVSTTGTGDIVVDARDVSALDARSGVSAKSDLGSLTLNSIASSIGPSIAFNSMGWDPGNVLFAALDALLGTSLGTEDPVQVLAFIVNSSVTAGGDLTVIARSEAQLNATISNAAESTASSLFGASGMAVSGILASNMVSSAARAYIDYTGITPGQVQAGGTITVSAEDNSGSGIYPRVRRECSRQ
ncbi:MAG: hypothetical protein O2857_15315 [Planctomycetota bacterium]|nr:hypothetical protein [Planctomycetota bacterium]